MSHRRGFHPPLASSYAAKVALVLVALCPFVAVTTATQLLQKRLLADLHTAQSSLSVSDGLANAGYALGAVVAVALLKRFPPRRVFMACELALAGGGLVAALSGDLVVFAIGRVVEGLATGLLLVAALPPLVTQFEARRLPVTVAVVDIGLFGATTLGPLIGGVAAAHDAWRTVFFVVAGLGVAGVVLGAIALERGEPRDPQGTLDPPALALAAGGTALPFFGASELVAHPATSWWALPWLLAGAASLITLIIREYRIRHPLTPVRLLAHTIPIVGIIAAMAGGAAAVGTLDLLETWLVEVRRATPLSSGLAFWPEVAAIAVAAIAFGSLFRSRHVPLLVVAGGATLLAAALLLAVLEIRSGRHVLEVAAALVGFGAGATVSPGLFLAALSIPSDQLGPAFALVELLRSEAAFVLAPVVLEVTMAYGTSPTAVAHGVHVGAVVVTLIVGAGLVTCALLWLAGGRRAQPPDLDGWVDGGSGAFDSPPVAAAVRSGRS